MEQSPWGAVNGAMARCHQPDYSFSMFGTDPVPPKSLLATIVLGLAGLQVLLALWMYRKLPPAAGGTLAVIVGVLWYTSALWYYNGYQLPHM